MRATKQTSASASTQQSFQTAAQAQDVDSTRANVTLSGILGPYKPGRPRNEMQNEGMSKAGLGNFGHISLERC